jgi:hypothetical protein
VVHHVVFGGQDEADDIGPAGAQTDPGAVGNIADFGGDSADQNLGLVADVGGIVQGAADRWNRQPSEL